MAINSVEITSPVLGAVTNLQVAVDVNVWRDGPSLPMVLVAVTQEPPTDEDAPWNPSSPGHWQACTPGTNQLQFHCVVPLYKVGAYFVHARASLTPQFFANTTTWIDWTADAQRIEITVRA